MDDKTIIKNLKKFFTMIAKNLKIFFNELKNKTNRYLFLSIILVVTATIAFVVIYPNISKPAEPVEEPVATPDPSDPNVELPDDSATVKVYNKQLTADMVTFQGRLLSFRAKNKNAVPYGNDTWKHFFEDYLSFENEYKFVSCDFAKDECKLPEKLTWEKDKLVVYVANNAICSSTTGTLIKSTGNGKVANYTHLRGESNGTFCHNN